ncbi:MAG: peptidylprolyl isomerase [Coriobacteriia bacterium]|nr:peptidylprolyl isomerase [Coriobacteriia bacterium]
MKKTTLVILLIIPVLLIGLVGCACNSQKQKVTYSENNFNQTDTAEIVIKNYGTIVVGLDANQAPKTVENFKKLANQGFYNGLTFHRIIKDFMMQGGDPKGDGTGGSPDKVKGEFSSNGINNTLAHTRGAISMARSQSNDSGSSQFFIMQKTNSSLDGQYACFGYVQSGIEIVDKICNEAKPSDNNGTIPKANQPIIQSITIK